MLGHRFVKTLPGTKTVQHKTYHLKSELPGSWNATLHPTFLLIGYPAPDGQKARIKRLRLEADQLNAVGEAYIHALGQLMAGERRVTLFSHPVATGDDASKALQHELGHRGINLEDVLRAVKRKHRADVET